MIGGIETGSVGSGESEFEDLRDGEDLSEAEAKESSDVGDQGENITLD